MFVLLKLIIVILEIVKTTSMFILHLVIDALGCVELIYKERLDGDSIHSVIV